MAYELSFSPEFFFAEGEPYDTNEPALNSRGQPVSVWTAIGDISRSLWAAMAEEIFECEPDHLTPETVLEKIQETNTCSNLNSPVRVWIDPEGYYTVDVYDKD